MSDNKVIHFFNSLSDDMKKIAKDLFTEIKEEKFQDPSQGTPSYTEVPMPDGTVLKVTSLDKGGEVIVVTPSGEVPAPEGDLTLADGTILTIKKEGDKSVIADIKPPASMADNKNQDSKFADIDSKLKTIESKFAEENKKISTEIEGLKLKLAQKSAQLKKTVEVLEAFASVPTAEPIKKPVVKTDKNDEMIKRLFGDKK